MESDQYLNELERKTLEDLRSQPAPSESENANIHSEPNSVPESSIDIKELLLSYNDLSTSFRTYLSSNLNDFATALITDLKAENSQLRKEKSNLAQHLAKFLQEHFKSITFTEDSDLLDQRYFSERTEAVNRMQSELAIARDIIFKQEKVIQSLQEELQGQNSVFLQIEDELKEKKQLQAEASLLQKTCDEQRKVIFRLKEQTRLNSAESIALKAKIRTLLIQEKVSGEVQKSLAFEVSSLKKILNEYESEGFAKVNRCFESKIFADLESQVAELFDSKQKIFKLGHENKELSKKNERLLNEIEGIKIEHEAKLSSAELLQASQKEAAIQNLKKNIKEIQVKYDGLESTVSKLQEELDDSQKNLKRVSKELESVVSVTSKRVEQLEQAIVQKDKKIGDLEKVEKIEPVYLEKLIMLLYKIGVS